jgi:phosphatidylglycerol:prolipoprotein diacylglycerol transferase
MHPLLTVVELGPYAIPIGNYGVLLCGAVAVAAAAALRAARAQRLDHGAAIATCGVVTASAFIGGFTLHVLVQWARTGSLITAASLPGLTVVGALPAAALGLAIAARALDQPALAWLERALPGLFVAVAIGRVGCLLGGCCFGTPSELPWSVRYTDPLAPAAALGPLRHPVPLYEALCVLGLAAGLAIVRRGTSVQRIGAGLLGYALARSVLELLRGDAVRGVWPLGLSTAQVGCGIASVAWLGWVRLQAARTDGARPRPDGV